MIYIPPTASTALILSWAAAASLASFAETTAVTDATGREVAGANFRRLHEDSC